MAVTNVVYSSKAGEISPVTQTNPDVICIIGMHRSGTSMVARLLNLCGLYLGQAEQLFGPNSGNPEGHFEHTGFISIDDALLQHFGGSWDYPPQLESGWHRARSLETLVSDAKSLVATFPSAALWGWKEPRTTLLLPFWKLIVPNLRFVICIRNPLEVAKSLAKRNGMTIEQGAYLWNRYLRAAIRDTDGCARIFTFYDDFFIDVFAEIERLIRFCNLPCPNECSLLQDAISSELRHHTTQAQEVLEETSIATEYKLLYIGLRALSHGTSGSEGAGSGTGDSINTFLRLLDEFHSQEKMAQLQTELAEQAVYLSDARIKMEKLLRERKQLTEHVDRLQRFSDAVRQTLPYRFYSTFIKPFGLR